MIYHNFTTTQASTSSIKIQNPNQQQPPLIPGLPDHISHLCLSHIHPSLLFSVCRSWRRHVYSPSFPPYLSLYMISSSENGGSNNQTRFFNFDPVSSKWKPLPPPPSPPSHLQILPHHPSFLSRNLPIQSVSVSGKLILLAASNRHLSPALPRPLIFNPISFSWRLGPPLATPRRWCVTGACGETVIVASGIGYRFSTDVSRSVEKWEVEMNDAAVVSGGGEDRTWKWETVRCMKDGRFSRDAITAVGWRGKLCMVNVEGDAPKEGIVYDVAMDEWEEMPAGMVGGWKGVVAAMDEMEMYMVVDDGVKGMGSLRKYDEERDDWEDVVIQSELLRGAQHVAVGGGRVCVVTAAGVIVTVDIVAVPPARRLWVVEAPPGLQPLALHILPRMSQLDLPSPVKNEGVLD